MCNVHMCLYIDSIMLQVRTLIHTIECMAMICSFKMDAEIWKPFRRWSGFVQSNGKEGREGLANFALDCVSTDQSDISLK